MVVFFKVLEGSHQVPRNTSRCARRRNVTLHYWEPKQEKHIPSSCQLGRYITGFKRLGPQPNLPGEVAPALVLY